MRERLGSAAVDEVDWRSARAVCIAGDFSRHDRVAVYDNRSWMDLVRYRVFDGGLLSLILIESSPGSAGPGPNAAGRPGEVSDLRGGLTAEGRAAGMPVLRYTSRPIFVSTVSRSGLGVLVLTLPVRPG